MRQCANKDAGGLERGGFDGGPTSIEERNDCQLGRWASKGVDYEMVSEPDTR